jgi:zinc finger HIT domain-containing protein 1
MANREARSKEAGRVLDVVARARRQKKALESLEQDNFQEEPHADLGELQSILSYHLH